MHPVPLILDPTPMIAEAGVTRRLLDDDGKLVCVRVYVRVPWDSAETYQLDARGDVDYYLAHELGHALRIATNAESDEVRRVYDYIEKSSEIQTKEAKENYLKERSREIREMIVQRETEAWHEAQKLFDGVEHDPERLGTLRDEALAGYRDGLLSVS